LVFTAENVENAEERFYYLNRIDIFPLFIPSLPWPRPNSGPAQKTGETMVKIFLIAGARPNFMKIAPIYRETVKHDQVECMIVHTGQHYDYEMSQAFFEDLEIPKPHFFPDAGSGSHAVQAARIMVAFEEVCNQEKPA